MSHPNFIAYILVPICSYFRSKSMLYEIIKIKKNNKMNIWTCKQEN